MRAGAMALQGMRAAARSQAAAHEAAGGPGW